MRVWSTIAVITAGVAIACAPKTEPTPVATPVAQAPGRAGGPPQGGAQPDGQPGAPRPRREPPSPLRLDTLRKAEVAKVLESIKGRENEPAGKVFQNVQLFKDMPAKEFLTTVMDEQYGRGLSLLCTGCHTDDRKWESDARKDKIIARQMEKMQRDIDSRWIAKNKEIDKPAPKVTCVMCHRGTGHMPNTMDVPTAPVPQRRRG
ncbi:MAG: photosynthetic reaction center cytochrome c subunit [Gemmatimonadaceae bacterium]|nr:photosynthetic reaction center cytochrome c subunit [Gemmatimonadaceae bacterium]